MFLKSLKKIKKDFLKITAKHKSGAKIMIKKD